ncbi:hypothetical protein COX95_02815 [bacterium CG_4_10_14_0_2_um_filter_33_32]|nr:MAG: hypothetical protein AUJ93_01020 [bacterium CG2_30_33_46]PIR67462.1 MAG: hypothetical protein COU50_03190 [bacterium CG10_big_fil_rev_8_21_14_0_10_33_18]PIU76382.1 MAG: hypothetical protein COS74_04370 [bacterium CG06_land_8_20_14_3_00_33_50]PIW81268.1 MAG: hypothetical protein COZ97_02715 [bacterium CG_4_8_14_3_um_filter_33_28]PIY85691.1 MAG: hypothetical protein COY76_00895 [bacterium CG_4_10_14_0_8_um_filter_33_57]PIZ85839.1 MAG: hypothetical protein COX95_02815 [bacterium CG_4_10_1
MEQNEPQASVTANAPKKNTSKPVLVALIAVIVLIISVDGFLAYRYLGVESGSNTNTTTQNPIDNSTASNSTGETTKSSSTSDTQLDNDLKSVDNKLSQMDTETAEVDNGLNDQQVDLSN